MASHFSAWKLEQRVQSSLIAPFSRQGISPRSFITEMSEVGRVIIWMEEWRSCIWTRYLQYVPGAIPWWKVPHARLLHARLTLLVVAEFLKDVYNALQEWDHGQGMFLNCFSYRQLLPRIPNNKWQGLSFTLGVTPASVGVVEQAAHLCAVCLHGSCGPLAEPLWLK